MEFALLNTIYQMAFNMQRTKELTFINQKQSPKCSFQFTHMSRYVLNGFRDENKEIQDLAFDLMECIGQQ